MRYRLSSHTYQHFQPLYPNDCYYAKRLRLSSMAQRLDASEKDHKAGRVTKRKSLRELIA